MLAERISGLHLVTHDVYRDHRGSFRRTWDASDYGALGQELRPAQISVSRNSGSGTLRGMHYLDISVGEFKNVTCIQGQVQDVVVDMRKDSPTFKQYMSFDLSELNNATLTIPPGCAHGFQLMSEEATLLYAMPVTYQSNMERGVRFDDPKLAIAWLLTPENISQKDLNWPLL